MSKKVLILSGSPRKGGNSDILCDEFLRGAQDAGHKAEKIRIAEKKAAPCSGCYYCSTHGGACVHKDDMADILQKMIDADVIVLASPVYFYSISAQLKTVIDRTVARWLEVKDKEFYYITTMADEEKASADLNGRGRGDMYVKCEVEIPKKLNKTQREALKKFEGTLKEENYEKRKGFFKKLKDMFNN